VLRSVSIGAGFVAAMFAGAVVAHAQEPVETAVAEATMTVTATPVATAAPVATATPVPTPVPTPVATATPVRPPPPPSAPPRAVAAQTPAPTPTATPTPAPAPVEEDECAQPGLVSGCAVSLDDCTQFGTPGDDVLIGSEAAEVLCGLAGNDVIDGGGGDDSIYGGDGNDEISGGRGDDCMIGGDGDDEFPDREDGDVVSQDGLGSGDDAFIDADEKGHCKGLEFGGGIETPPAGSGGGGITGAAASGSLLLDIVQSTEGPAAGGSVSVGDRGSVRDGVATLLLTCKTAVEGTVVLEVERGSSRQRVGRGPFRCEPPSDPAEIELTQAGRRQLEQRGSLKVTARVKADGRQIASEPVVISPAEG
jgi:hypothetical protein